MFRFRLDFLVRYRKQKENMEMSEMAKCVRDANRIQAELEDIHERHTQIRESIQAQGKETIPGPVFCMYTEYQEHLRRCGAQAEKKLVRAENRIERQREILVTASIDRKIIERYKEKQKTLFDEEEAVRELKNLDELSSLARSRKNDD